MIDALPLLNRVIELATQLGVERQEGEALGIKYRDAVRRGEDLRRRLDEAIGSALRNDNIVGHLRKMIAGGTDEKDVVAYLKSLFAQESPF